MQNKKNLHKNIQHSSYSFSKYHANLFPRLLERSLKAKNFKIYPTNSFSRKQAKTYKNNLQKIEMVYLLNLRLNGTTKQAKQAIRNDITYHKNQ